MIQIISSGFSGEGINTIGKVIAKAAEDNGKYAVCTELKSNIAPIDTHSEKLAENVSCLVKISDKKISSTEQEGDIDVLIAMSPAAINRFEKEIKPGGYMIVNSTRVNKYMIKNKKYRHDIRKFEIPAVKISLALGHLKGTNIVVLGTFVAATKLFDKREFRESMIRYFDDINARTPLNNPCFDKGAYLFDEVN